MKTLLTFNEKGDIMSVDMNNQLDFKHLKIINRILEAGNRVELIPVKDGIKIIEIKRQEVK